MCPYDGFSYPEVEPRLFSFNSPYGACSECNGLGTRHFFGDEVCPKCKGARLRDEALHVRLGSIDSPLTKGVPKSARAVVVNIPPAEDGSAPFHKGELKKGLNCPAAQFRAPAAAHGLARAGRGE